MNDFAGQLKTELLLRNYSPKTVLAYCRCMREFESFLGNKLPDDGTLVREFLIKIKERPIASQTFNLYVNSLRFFYKNILKRHLRVEVKSARRVHRLPIVLTKNEIELLLNVTMNRKHKLLLALAYGAGLRVSEVIKIRVCDIDIQQSTLFVHEGKGRKDRMTLLPQKLKNDVVQYMAGKNAHDFLFISERGGRLTDRSAQHVFKSALEKSKITKTATFHSLRHSFATHLIENGVNIRFVQELLGHASILTTQRYTHVSQQSIFQIRSPFDEKEM